MPGLEGEPTVHDRASPRGLAERIQFPSLEKVMPFASRMFMVEAVYPNQVWYFPASQMMTFFPFRLISRATVAPPGPEPAMTTSAWYVVMGSTAMGRLPSYRMQRGLRVTPVKGVRCGDDGPVSITMPRIAGQPAGGNMILTVSRLFITVAYRRRTGNPCQEDNTPFTPLFERARNPVLSAWPEASVDMKIAVLNGSPKGTSSVTMQYVLYIQKHFPEHELEIIGIHHRTRKMEKDDTALQETLDVVRSSEGVLWAFPVYYMLVPGYYKRFIELIWEKGVEDVFRDKHAAVLATSIKYFDHAALYYMQAICEDLGMKYHGSFSPEMYLLAKEQGRAKTRFFAGIFFDEIKNETVAAKSYPPGTLARLRVQTRQREKPGRSRGEEGPGTDGQ